MFKSHCKRYAAHLMKFNKLSSMEKKLTILNQMKNQGFSLRKVTI